MLVFQKICQRTKWMIPIHRESALSEDFRINAKRLFRVNKATFSALRYYLAKRLIKIYHAKYMKVKSKYFRKSSIIWQLWKHTNRPTILLAFDQKHCQVYRKVILCNATFNLNCFHYNIKILKSPAIPERFLKPNCLHFPTAREFLQ